MSGESDIEFQIGRLTLGPDDILVVKVGEDMRIEDWKSFAKSFKAMVPENRLLMVSGDVEISVLTPAEIEARGA
ncbi:MAG TPA: hypothetical protein DEQ40_00480 [Oxalobacteraceae bacterium]|jgi:hypothetical protein|nr:hypothetical protein [Oxalobacteraceae bacterium]